MEFGEKGSKEFWGAIQEVNAPDPKFAIKMEDAAILLVDAYIQKRQKERRQV